MARTVRVGDYQAMQRNSGPSHVGMIETEAAGDAATENGQAVATVDPLSGQVVDATTTEQTMAERLQRLGVELLATADMPRSLIVAKILEKSYGMRPAPTNEDIQAEADRIWTSFGENRSTPLAVTVNGDGTIAGVRPAEMTPDRGPDVGTTHHAVAGDDQRFSGAGAEDDTRSSLVPTDQQFNGRLYREAPELANIAERLIGEHGFLEDLQHCDIRWYWKRKTGVAKGRVKIGFMKRASDLLGHFSGADFIGWLSATTARDGRFTDQQVEAAVFHQLLHVGSDDKGNWIFSPHDFEGFAQEVRVYGTWTEDLMLGGTAFVAAHQMGLFDATDEDDDDDDEDGEDVAEEIIEQIDATEGPADADGVDPLADHDL